jgi:Domain of unknown function (DUF4350)
MSSRNSRSWVTVGICGVVIVIVGALVAGFLTFFEPVEKQIRLPPKGPALYNPLYALERSLVRAGIDAKSHARLDMAAMKLRPGDGLVLYSDPQLLPKPQVDELLAWVGEGGHLVIGMPDDARDEPGAMLDALSLEAVDSSRSCERLQQKPKAAIEPVLCDGPRFGWNDREADLAWGERDEGFAYARFPVGRGTVDVLNGLDFLSTARIERAANWQLAYQVLAPALDGRLHLVYDADLPSFWPLLWKHAWAILIGGALALAAWLLMRGQRFGPLLPVAPAPRRALLEHVQAAGEHAWRRGAARDLHAALRDVFLARLRRRDPMAWALQGDQRIDYLAAKFAVDPARVRTALVPPPVFHAESFREAMASLIQLGLRL